ncbi:MAG: hypothetical protein HY892_20970 [Deltaproteobacteria bacterium]|nr:hypothetical protein [Deltaproteobacteria bacterium]
MSHWKHRPEAAWKDFHFNQPYEKGLTRLREEVLAKTDFDPAVLWQWGTMQGMAVIRILKDCEKRWGKEGQQVVAEALKQTGLDIGRQVLKNVTRPETMSEAEFISFFATVVNRIVYASLEAPQIDSPDQVSFDILWCPHQENYRAFDCRVQRYLVQGMLEALEETGMTEGFQLRFDCTIPAGAQTCHFTIWQGSEEEKKAWDEYTRQLEEKALSGNRAENT